MAGQNNYKDDWSRSPQGVCQTNPVRQNRHLSYRTRPRRSFEIVIDRPSLPKMVEGFLAKMATQMK